MSFYRRYDSTAPQLCASCRTLTTWHETSTDKSVCRECQARTLDSIPYLEIVYEFEE